MIDLIQTVAVRPRALDHIFFVDTFALCDVRSLVGWFTESTIATE